MAGRPAKPNGPVIQDAMRALTLRRLMKNDMNYSKTARECGVHRTTIMRWWGELDEEQRDEIRGVVEEDVATLWRAVEDAALSELIGRVPNMKDHDLVVTAGVAADKAMRYGGIPDASVSTVTVAPADIAEEIEGMLRAVQQRASTSKTTERDTAHTG